MKNRIIAVLLGLLLLVILPMTANAEFPAGANLTWTFDESTGTLTVEGKGDMYDYRYPEDSGVQELPPWAQYLDQIKTIVLPEGLTKIGANAFAKCTALTSVTIPDSVQMINRYAFRECPALKTVDLGSGTTEIGLRAFYHCTGLTSITIPGNVETVGDDAFANCTALTSATVKSGVKQLGNRVFQGCTKLTSITIEDGIRRIGENAFSNTGWWNSQPNGILYIGHCLIARKNTYPQNLAIPDGTKMIADFALWGCSNMKSVTIPDSVEYIGSSAFGQCKGIESLTLPNGLKGIGESAFSRMEKLKTLVVPDSVTEIGTAAFNACTSLQSITLPNALERIEKKLLNGCSALTAITIPDSVIRIGEEAFKDCTGLTAVTIPEGVQYIGDDAFSGCSAVKSLTVPCGLSLSAFLNCKAIESVRLTKGTGTMKDYTEANYKNTPWYRTGAASVSVVLDEGIQNIGAYAFKECTKLKSVTIPSSVTSIGMFAFYGCTKLTDVYYNGTETQRNATLVTIGSSNDSLNGATWHYALEEERPFEGTVAFDGVSYKGATPYVIGNGKKQTPALVIKDENGLVIDPFYYDAVYTDNTQPGTAHVDVTFKNGYTGTYNAWFKIYLPATNYTKVENVQAGIRVTWNAVPGAKGYVVYRRAWSTTTNGWTNFARWDNTTELSYLDGYDENHRTYAGTRYQYGVKAYFEERENPDGTIMGGAMDNYNLGIVGPLKTTVRITTRVLNSLTPGSKRLTVKWTPSKNFTGYEIQLATDAAFTKNLKTVTITAPLTSETTVKSLKAKTMYYVRIRSYHEFEGFTYYGEWSNVLNAKTK